MLIEVKGLVIRTVDLKESDRLLTIFTEEMGAVTALARGARTLKSRKMSSTMQFCYSSFILFKKDDRYTVRDAELIESFFGIRDSIEGLALAAYIADVLSDVTTAEGDRDLLRLSLNSLYAISTGKYSLPAVKAAFEMRAASILGFMPDVLGCTECGERRGEFFFDIMGGYVECPACRKRRAATDVPDPEDRERRIVRILSEPAHAALAYSIHSPLERLFSFKLSDEDQRLFSLAAEDYITNQLERLFKTLDFYNKVKRD